MTGTDDEALKALLRARLDTELASVHAHPLVLADLLSRPVPRRSRKGWAAGVAAMTALGPAVAVAVAALPSPGRDAIVQLAGPSPSTVPGLPSASATPRTTPTGPSPTCPQQSSDPGGGALHIVLGAGRGEVSSALPTASPYLTVLPVSTTGTTRHQVLIGMRGKLSAAGSVGGVARLYDLRDCTFAPVPGVNGKPYDFLIGNASDTQRAASSVTRKSNTEGPRCSRAACGASPTGPSPPQGVRRSTARPARAPSL